jgi:hypothetical protein
MTCLAGICAYGFDVSLDVSLCNSSSLPFNVVKRKGGYGKPAYFCSIPVVEGIGHKCMAANIRAWRQEVAHDVDQQCDALAIISLVVKSGGLTQ